MQRKALVIQIGLHGIESRLFPGRPGRGGGIIYRGGLIIRRGRIIIHRLLPFHSLPRMHLCKGILLRSRGGRLLAFLRLLRFLPLLFLPAQPPLFAPFRGGTEQITWIHPQQQKQQPHQQHRHQQQPHHRSKHLPDGISQQHAQQPACAAGAQGEGLIEVSREGIVAQLHHFIILPAHIIHKGHRFPRLLHPGDQRMPGKQQQIQGRHDQHIPRRHPMPHRHQQLHPRPAQQQRNADAHGPAQPLQRLAELGKHIAVSPIGQRQHKGQRRRQQRHAQGHAKSRALAGGGQGGLGGFVFRGCAHGMPLSVFIPGTA